MKPNFRKYDWRKIKVVGAIFLILMALFFSGRIPWSGHSFFPVHELEGQKALAGETDIKGALVDSILHNDTLIAVDTTAAPGDSFWVTVKLTNITIPVAGVSMMLTYDTSIINPTYTVTDPCYPNPPCTTYLITGYKTERTLSLPFYLWVGRARNNRLDTLEFNFVTDIFTSPITCLPAGGSGPIVRFKFRVKPQAQAGATTNIHFVFWDYMTQNYANTLADTIGLHVFIPQVKDGIFTVSGGGPPNIPTLTDWGLIVFGVMLLGFITWVFLKRRKVIGVRV
jgi:cbb3-type cytochrome oxidase subunit 3